MRALLICTCSGMADKAPRAFRIAFPDDEEPPIYRGKDAIRRLAEQHPDTNLGKYLLGITRKSGKFAYFVESNERGDITTLYDLIVNKRVA